MSTPVNFPESAPPRRLIGVREVATMLGVSIASVWRLRAAGRLPKAVRLGGAVRWRLREIERFIDGL
jgi:predicted DNA-binding transcriptional regulator AlpA